MAVARLGRAWLVAGCGVRPAIAAPVVQARFKSLNEKKASPKWVFTGNMVGTPHKRRRHVLLNEPLSLHVYNLYHNKVRPLRDQKQVPAHLTDHRFRQE